MNIIDPKFPTPIYIHQSLTSRVVGKESYGIGRGVSIVVFVPQEQILDFETRQKHPKRKGSYRLLPGEGSIRQCYSLPFSSLFPSSYLFSHDRKAGSLKSTNWPLMGFFRLVWLENLSSRQLSLFTLSLGFFYLLISGWLRIATFRLCLG